MDIDSYKPDNSQNQLALRRWRDALATSAIAVVALSVWDIIKFFIGLFLGSQTLMKIYTDGMKEIAITDEKLRTVTGVIFIIMVVGLFLLVSLIIFLIHFYIGRNAWRIARELTDQRKIGYLVLTVLSLVMSIYALIYNVVVPFFAPRLQAHVSFSSFILEAAALTNYLLLLLSVYKIRKLEGIKEEPYDTLAAN